MSAAVDSFDYTRRDVMIPMRDGVKLHAVILVPKGAKGAPILMTRTPYDATALTTHARSAHLGPILQGYDNAVDVIVEGGYIRVVEDVRGKYGSEGDYARTSRRRPSASTTPRVSRVSSNCRWSSSGGLPRVNYANNGTVTKAKAGAGVTAGSPRRLEGPFKRVESLALIVGVIMKDARVSAVRSTRR